MPIQLSTRPASGLGKILTGPKVGGIVELESCPKCTRPRAIGYRCPSCGEAPAVVDQQPAANGATAWKTDVSSWQAPRSSEISSGRPAAGPHRPSPGAKRRRGLVATAIVAVLVIAVVAAVAVMLTTGGAALVEEQASVAAVPEKARDLAAQSLIRNAMTAIDAAFVESGDYTAVTQLLLETMEPAIAWKQGRSRVCMTPPASAKTRQNAVGWVCTGRLVYELGTWSESGMEFGVRVDKAGGGATYYRDGEAVAW